MTIIGHDVVVAMVAMVGMAIIVFAYNVWTTRIWPAIERVWRGMAQQGPEANK
jgi:hypothetical protein